MLPLQLPSVGAVDLLNLLSLAFEQHLHPIVSAVVDGGAMQQHVMHQHQPRNGISI